MRRRQISSALLSAATGGAFASAVAAGGTIPPASGRSGTPRTAAEIQANIDPSASQYPEGDIRRYGAETSAPDNSQAIDRALLVSSCGGNAAYVPPGSWPITTSVTVVGTASMFGAGNASVIVAHACDGLTFSNGGNYAATGTARFLRDLRIVGSDAAGSAHEGIRVDLSVASEQRVTGVDFDNLHIANFRTAIHLRGLYNSNFNNCFLYNNYRGFHFHGQTITTSIANCNIQRGKIAGTGGAWGVWFDSVDGESTEDTHISGGQIYGFDVNIKVDLAFELQIEHCDVSEAESIGIQVTATIGGLWIRDCWIETAKTAVTSGIRISDITPSADAKVNITGNYLNCDFPFPGSKGIEIGNANAGIVINENQVHGFDRGIILGASAHAVCKFNTIDVNSRAFGAASCPILVDSLSTGNDIGPNYIVPGAKRAAIADGRHAITVDSAGAALPVGSPVQFERSGLGIVAGVTYFVASSSGNIISVAASPGEAPVALTGTGELGQVFAAPLPLSFTAGTPAGLSFHGCGAFIMTLGGCTAPIAGAVNWEASGRLVALSPAAGAALVGSSRSPELEARGLPKFLLPPSTQAFAAAVVDSGECGWGVGRLIAGGALVFHPSPAQGPFSASGTKGLGGISMTYPYA